MTGVDPDDRTQQATPSAGAADDGWHLAQDEGGSTLSTIGPGIDIGPYRIDRRLGVGGMGEVFLAEHRTLRRRVAVKVLGDHVANDAGFASRFLREARLSAAVDSPRLVAIHDAGRWRGQLLMIQEFVPGGDVEDLLDKEGPLPAGRALEIIADAAEGVAALEANRLVHRDIKPGNILLTADGRAKLGDFGLARSSGGQDRMTETGIGLGTPAYMSPEQARGVADIDSRTDMYSLGATLFTLLTGERPYTGTTPWEVVDGVLNKPPPDLRTWLPSADRRLCQLIEQAMAKDRDQRFQHTAAFREALAATLADRRPVGAGAAGQARDALAARPGGAAGPEPRSRTARARRRRGGRKQGLWIPVAAVAIVGVGALFAWWAITAGTPSRMDRSTSLAQAGSDPASSGGAGRVDPPPTPAPASPTEVAAGERPVLASTAAAPPPSGGLSQPTAVGPPPSGPPPTMHIHVHGNSLASGSGSEYQPPVRLLDGRFAALDAAGALTATGYPGQGVTAIAQSLSGGALTAQHLAGVVVLWPARNSVTRHPKETRTTVAAMVAEVERRGSGRWLISECPLTPSEAADPADPGRAQVEAYNRWLVERFGTERVIPAADIAVTYPDGTNHPDTEGYFVWAGRLGDRLVELGWYVPELPRQIQRRSVETTAEDQVITLEEYPGRAAHLPTDPVADHTALVWYKGEGSGYAFGRNDPRAPENRWGLRIYRDGLGLHLGSAFVHEADLNPSDGRWHLIGWVVSNGVGRLVFDGRLGAKSIAAAPVPSPRPWTVAGGNPPVWSPLGRYAAAAVWDVALDADELRSVYNGGSIVAPAALPRTDDLVALLPLDAHRERATRGWPDLIGNAGGNASNLWSTALVDDVPGGSR